MNPNEEPDIDREGWRRRLGDAGAPSFQTDARIRAEARRALAPRTSRWTLPASLAAALVLAVALAQWQIVDERLHPLIDESEVRQERAPAVKERALTESAPAEALPASEPAPDEALNFSIESPERAQRSDETRERSARQPAASEERFVPSPAPMVDLPAEPASEAPHAAAAELATAAPAPEQAPAAPASPREQSEAAAGATGSISVTGSQVKAQKMTAPRAPEDWYAEIEKLRAAGRDAEADAELEKLEAAYPGWLERHRSKTP